jgi:hypothetical protein
MLTLDGYDFPMVAVMVVMAVMPVPAMMPPMLFVKFNRCADRFRAGVRHG